MNRVLAPALLALVPLLASLLAAPVFGGCGGANPTPPPVAPVVATPPPTPVTPPPPDESFRATPPPLGADVTFVAPNIQEKRLSNGVRVLVVERHDLPVVDFELAFDRGADQEKAGVGSFAGAMLLQGTKTRSALQLSDDFERLGASHGAWVDYDASHVTVSCLAGKFAPALALAADVAQHPAFAKDEVERERAHRLTAITQQSDRPGTILGNTVAELLYPAGHPYASTLLGTADVVKGLSAADLRRFHGEAFRPDRLTVAVSGDVRFADVVAQVEAALGKWKGTAPKAKTPATPALPNAEAPRVVLVDRPGATQSQVAVTLVGLPRFNPDYDALLVMNTLLGGAFSSRLNMNLREAHAYTYGARSGFEFRHGPGPFTAGGAIVRESTGPAVMEILKEVDRIRTEPVSDAELADAKAYLVRALPARFETVGDTAGTLATISVYGLPLDEYATRPARIQHVSAEDVKRVATKYLLPSALRVVVVGDAKVVQDQLGHVGLGSVTMRQAPNAAAEAPKPKKKK